MFNIEYYGKYGSYLGVDKNVSQAEIPTKLAEFGRVADGGDSIKIVAIDGDE